MRLNFGKIRLNFSHIRAFIVVFTVLSIICSFSLSMSGTFDFNRIEQKTDNYFTALNHNVYLFAVNPPKTNNSFSAFSITLLRIFILVGLSISTIYLLKSVFYSENNKITLNLKNKNIINLRI